MTHTGKGRGRWYVKGPGIQGPKFFYSPHKATSYIDIENLIKCSIIEGFIMKNMTTILI